MSSITTSTASAASRLRKLAAPASVSLPQIGEALQIVHLVEGILDPEHAVIFERAADALGGVHAPQAVQFAHDLDAVADGVADFAEGLQSGLEVGERDRMTAIRG